eukprot:Nitzschia sp. Nitz4//scaffold124_size66437//16077//16499//NITZ4_006105-RA/size66437-processed-gene-0.98-mRNA-1//-1//CDS//3329534534//4323//frame0
MKKSLPPPYPLHIHFENLPRIDEERTSSEGYGKIRLAKKNVGAATQRKLPCSDSIPGTPRLAYHNERPENDISLEEKCLIYEALAASLRDEILSIQGQSFTSDKSLRSAMRYLMEEKEGLMKECNQLEEKIHILTCESSN